MGINIKDLQAMKALAQDKNNGVFAFKGKYYYTVISHEVNMVGDRTSGVIYRLCCGFTTEIGIAKSYDMKKKMLNCIKGR